jgi:arsenate reductase-like glutaredoxin family protein
VLEINTLSVNPYLKRYNMIKNIRAEHTAAAIRFLFTALTVLFCSINSYTAGNVTDIIVYGNEKCGYCKETMNWLEIQKIPFVYRDVVTYGTNQEEMFSKLEKAGFTSTAYFPVLDVKGQILMKPEFDDITKALSGEKVNNRAGKKIRNPQWRPQKLKSLTTDFSSLKNNLRESDIIFYDDGSGSGKVLMRNLKKELIPFTIKQLNKLSNADYFDMSARLSALGYGNMTLFPVIEVRGEMIMNPSLDDVKVLIIEMIAE